MNILILVAGLANLTIMLIEIAQYRQISWVSFGFSYLILALSFISGMIHVG